LNDPAPSDVFDPSSFNPRKHIMFLSLKLSVIAALAIGGALVPIAGAQTTSVAGPHATVVAPAAQAPGEIAKSASVQCGNKTYTVSTGTRGTTCAKEAGKIGCTDGKGNNAFANCSSGCTNKKGSGKCTVTAQ
jgi:hypothetical protein